MPINATNSVCLHSANIWQSKFKSANSVTHAVKIFAHVSGLELIVFIVLLAQQAQEANLTGWVRRIASVQIIRQLLTEPHVRMKNAKKPNRVGIAIALVSLPNFNATASGFLRYDAIVWRDYCCTSHLIKITCSLRRTSLAQYYLCVTDSFISLKNSALLRSYNLWNSVFGPQIMIYYFSYSSCF